MKALVIVVAAIALLAVVLSVVVGLQHAKRRKSGMAGPQVTGQGRQVPDTPPPPANR